MIATITRLILIQARLVIKLIV